MLTKGYQLLLSLLLLLVGHYVGVESNDVRAKREVGDADKTSNVRSQLKTVIGLLETWKCPPDAPLPRDCADLMTCGVKASGVYTVYIGGMQRPIQVYCDMETDGGGWLVFQRRADGSVNFYRNWKNYASGFGNIGGEFWLGNDNIHALTSTGVAYHLRVDMADFAGQSRYAEYSNFKTASAADKYKVLSVGKFTGTAGDSLTSHVGFKFSTYDQDNDISSASCSQLFKGAWWYRACHSSNLNGRYLRGSHASYADGVNWYAWKGYHYSLKFTEMKIKPVASLPRDCADVMARGIKTNGVYTVYVGSQPSPVKVYCDMTTDGGGWLVFQRRVDGSVNFYRNWADYAKGFGDPGNEFWLGNDNIHALISSGKTYQLRVELADFAGNWRYAKYSDFKVASAADKYKLTSIGKYSGNAGDSMKRQEGMKFSTFDQDNDAYKTSCSREYKGAWWYEACHHSNLNGLYLKGKHTSFADGVDWYAWTGYYYSLRYVEMKIKPINK